MNVTPFFLFVEAIALLAVPAILALCVRLIVVDAQREKLKRQQAFDDMMRRTKERLERSVRERDDTSWRRIWRTAHGEVGSISPERPRSGEYVFWSGTGGQQFQDLRAGSRQWRQ
jgi:hypothetical protein